MKRYVSSSSRVRRTGRLLALLLGAASAFAESPTPAPEIPDKLDLQTAIGYALDNNFSIRQARERIREQEGLIVEVKSAIIPNVDLTAGYSKMADEIATQTSSGARSDQSWQIALTARQLLYSGGGVRAALDAQRLVRESALLDLQGVINQALLQVRTKFYEVLLAREQIKVQEQNVNLLEEQLKTAQNRFQAGAVSNFDVLRAEVAVANAKPALIRARNRFRTSIDELRLTLGYVNPTPGNERKVPEFLGSLDFTPVSYDLSDALTQARTNRPELTRLSKLAEARVANVRIQKAGYLPSVDVNAGYLVRKNYASNSFGESDDGWTVGIEGSWSIFDGRATAGKVTQAKSQLAQAQLNLEEAGLTIEVQVRSALSALQEAKELAEAAVKVVDQADEALRLADARYSAGTATQLDVLETRVALTQARDNQLQANYSYNVALANLRTAMGVADSYVPSK